MFNETASKDKLKLFKPWSNLVVVDLDNKSGDIFCWEQICNPHNVATKLQDLIMVV